MGRGSDSTSDLNQLYEHGYIGQLDPHAWHRHHGQGCDPGLKETLSTIQFLQ